MDTFEYARYDEITYYKTKYMTLKFVIVLNSFHAFVVCLMKTIESFIRYDVMLKGLHRVSLLVEEMLTPITL